MPLCPTHPAPEIEYVIEDSGAETVVAHPDFVDLLQPLTSKLGRELVVTSDLVGGKLGNLPSPGPDEPAMILYTSGTTSKPKGVVSTHGNLRAQIETLVHSWGWSCEDRTLLVLPLHHVHGIVNVLGCSLWAGACCHIHSSFDSKAVWQAFCDEDLSVFMGVPTLYSRLIRAYDEAQPERQREWSAACRRFRLMVSGSAALPVGTLERWREISGHTLLERYGMTETGMILSNPLLGERRPGTVGGPLPGVDVKLVDEEGKKVEVGEGEILVRGRAVFAEYWQRPEETRAAFEGDWFRTGDVARFDGTSYRILGRRNVDILKTGGYKVSALEIEEVLRSNSEIADCSVVGVEDPDWGERVCAAVVAVRSGSIDPPAIRAWAKERLAAYKVPQEIREIDELPRNALGKVTKHVIKLWFEDGADRE